MLLQPRARTRTTFKGDTTEIDQTTCKGGKKTDTLCLKGFGGPLCATCDDDNAFQLNRNSDNIDYTEGCMQCGSKSIASSRVTVLIYAVILVVITVPIAYFHAEVSHFFTKYLSFVLVLKAKLEEHRDKTKVMLTYYQVQIHQCTFAH